MRVMRRAATPPLFLAALVSVFATVAGAACERQASAGADAAKAEKVAAPDTLPLRFSRNLVGTVGGERVDVWLRREGDVLSGTWLVEDDVEKWMSGTMDAGGAVSVPIYFHGDEAEATIEGTLAAGPAGITLTGRFLEPGKEPLAVALAEERIAIADGVHVEPTSWMDEDAEMGWSVHVEIPAAVAEGGAALPQAYAAFNRAADSLARADAEPFQREVLTWEGPSDEEAGASAYGSSYEVTHAGDDLVSIVFDAMTYYAGAAHPNHATWTLTWDFGAGRRVMLDDLFRSGTPYLQAISDAAVPELVQVLGPEMADRAWIEEGAAPEPDNYARWSLTREGLRIVFDPYQVAAYAAGPQVVVVRWSALEPLLDPAGPVARIQR
jgi:hypothetical protein